MLTAGLGGAARQGCVALSAAGTVVSVCGQERITRTKAAAFNATGLPDEALDVSIGQLGWRRGDVTRYVMAEPGVAQVGSLLVERIDHHFAHACTSYLTSPFPSAAIVVCDHEAPAVSVWLGRGAGVSAVEWAWSGHASRTDGRRTDATTAGCDSTQATMVIARIAGPVQTSLRCICWPSD